MRNDPLSRRAAATLGAAGLTAAVPRPAAAKKQCRKKRVQPELTYAHVDEIRFSRPRLSGDYDIVAVGTGRVFSFGVDNAVAAAEPADLIPPAGRGGLPNVFQVLGRVRRLTLGDAAPAGAPATVSCSFLVTGGEQDSGTGELRFSAALIGAAGMSAAGTADLPDLVDATILSTAALPEGSTS